MITAVPRNNNNPYFIFLSANQTLADRRYRGAWLVVAFGSVAASLALVVLFAYSSARNYPGGEALVLLHRLRTPRDRPDAVVHIDV